MNITTNNVLDLPSIGALRDWGGLVLVQICHSKAQFKISGNSSCELRVVGWTTACRTPLHWQQPTLWLHSATSGEGDGLYNKQLVAIYDMVLVLDHSEVATGLNNFSESVAKLRFRRER